MGKLFMRSFPRSASLVSYFDYDYPLQDTTSLTPSDFTCKETED